MVTAIHVAGAENVVVNERNTHTVKAATGNAEEEKEERKQLEIKVTSLITGTACMDNGSLDGCRVHHDIYGQNNAQTEFLNTKTYEQNYCGRVVIVNMALKHFIQALRENIIMRA